MMKKGLCLALAVLLLAASLSACGGSQVEPTEQTAPATVVTEPAPTVPADGNPKDVTCKGSYTEDEPNGQHIVAWMDRATLNNSQLQIYYWMEVAAYQASGQTPAPDFSAPLDSQSCEIDSSVNSWQQYFIHRALNTWHTVQALVLRSENEGIPTEEAYQPNMDNHAKYLTDIPAVKFLYGYHNNYRINTLHQAWLDAMPETLETLAQEKGFEGAGDLAQAVTGVDEETLAAYAKLYNEGYAYFTSLTYTFQPTQEEVEAWYSSHRKAYDDAGIRKNADPYVNLRQLLAIPQVPKQEVNPWATTTQPVDPLTLETVTVAEDGIVTCSEEMWQLGLEQAQELVEEFGLKFRKNQASAYSSTTDAVFADFAFKNSADTDTAPYGGLLRHVRKGQLNAEMEAWAFDPERQVGDIAIFRTEYGYQILHFSGREESRYVQVEQDLIASLERQALAETREKYPMTVLYKNIALSQVQKPGALTPQELLYADVAHERFPEIPLYLQQDYPTTRYGNYMLRGHGCGITTMAMVASYLADRELTPPLLCDWYGKYCFLSGTDGNLFNVTPSEMGFYVIEQTYDHREAYAALQEGRVVVCLQTKGYWTGGGHYLALEKLVPGQEDEESPRVQVRDSNIFNYGKLKDHKLDAFLWGTIPLNGKSYWIFEYKNVNTTICQRCGDPSDRTQHLLAGEYTCEKCEAAQMRRSIYLTGVAEQ